MSACSGTRLNGPAPTRYHIDLLEFPALSHEEAASRLAAAFGITPIVAVNYINAAPCRVKSNADSADSAEMIRTLVGQGARVRVCDDRAGSSTIVGPGQDAWFDALSSEGPSTDRAAATVQDSHADALKTDAQSRPVSEVVVPPTEWPEQPPRPSFRRESKPFPQVSSPVGQGRGTLWCPACGTGNSQGATSCSKCRQDLGDPTRSPSRITPRTPAVSF